MTANGSRIPRPVRVVDAAYRGLRPLLFRVEAERAHRLALAFLCACQAVLERRPVPPPTSARLAQSVAGLHFPNPIGLAAGFDKNARVPHVWPWLGFGFAELGTVTALPQAGHPRPRLFRLVEERALINRMGFNNDGAERVARRLERARRRSLPAPVGINIGRSRAAAGEGAWPDYRASFERLAPRADYVAINVSSPNTPGLRDLQEEQHLDRLLAELQQARAGLGIRAPLFVKVAPDLAPDALRSIARVCVARGVAGIIATNTTVRRDLLRHPPAEEGGLSGAPLRGPALEALRVLRQEGAGELVLVSVGGVFTVADVLERIGAGASLVQLYTALVYEGPALPWRLCLGLEAALAGRGCAHVAAAVGRAA